MSQSQVPECRHIMPSGRTCASPAIKGKPLCYQHSRSRTLVEANRSRRHTVALPPLEDGAAIQMALNEILAALSARKITRHEAGTYLFAVQIASQNLSRMNQERPTQPVRLCKDERGDILAPAQPSEPEATDPPDEIAAIPEQLPAFPDAATATPPEPGNPTPDDPLPNLLLPNLLLDDPNTCDTHEYDPEPPRPLTKTQQQQRRRQCELHLRSYREARTHYAHISPAEPSSGENPAVVLTYIENCIAKLEAELEDLKRLEAPEPDPRSSSVAEP